MLFKKVCQDSPTCEACKFMGICDSDCSKCEHLFINKEDGVNFCLAVDVIYKCPPFEEKLQIRAGNDFTCVDLKNF